MQEDIKELLALPQQRFIATIIKLWLGKIAFIVTTLHSPSHTNPVHHFTCSGFQLWSIIIIMLMILESSLFVRWTLFDYLIIST